MSLYSVQDKYVIHAPITTAYWWKTLPVLSEYFRQDLWHLKLSYSFGALSTTDFRDSYVSVAQFLSAAWAFFISFLLFSCTTCNLTVVDDITLRIAGMGRNWCVQTWWMWPGQPPLFSKVLFRFPVSFGGHRLLSVRFAASLCGSSSSQLNYTDVFISLFVNVIFNLIFLLFWVLQGDVNNYMKHWNKISYFQLYSILRSKSHARQLVGRRVFKTSNIK